MALSVLSESQKNQILQSIDNSHWELPWHSGIINSPSDTLSLFYKVHGDGNSASGGEGAEVEVK